jgi:aminopeptidase
MQRTAVVVLCVLALAAPALAQKAPAAKAPDTKTIAKQVVQDVARVKEGDVVYVTGDIRDWALLEDIVLEVQKRGGQVLLAPDREQAARRYYDEVPEKYIGRQATLWRKLWPLINVQIGMDAEEYPGLLKNVPPARFAANAKAWAPVVALIKKKGIRRVFIGNGLYPTAATAKQYGMTKDQLAALFYGGLAGDPARLQASAEAVRAALAKGKELQIKAANGTDLKVRIQGRPIVVSDGALTDAKLKKGGVAAWTWLPAGEVVLVPVPGTAEGKLVIERMPFEDGELVGLTLTVKAGKVTDMTAKPGPMFDRLKALYAAGQPRKDELSCLDFGANPDVKIPAGSKLQTYVPAGTLSFNVGANVACGGDIPGPFIFQLFLTDSTVTLDGAPLIDKGALKVGPAAKK